MATYNSRRKWRLRGFGAEYVVVPRAELSGDLPGKRLTEGQAALQVHEWLGSSQADVLWELYEALGGRRPSGQSRLQWEQERERMAERLASAFFSGELVAHAVEWTMPRAHPRALIEPLPGAESEAPPETTYVAIEMVDEDGKPVSGVRYRVTLPGGVVREGRLSATGYARLDGVDPGSCKISFPELDGSSWDKA